MRVRTLFAITLTMFALPAIAAETPTGTPLMLPPVAPSWTESTGKIAPDPCFPERYNHSAGQAVVAPFAQQTANGSVFKQTVWNYHFEFSTDKLTPAGREKLDALARTRPAPDPKIFLQTARDIPSTIETAKLPTLRAALDKKRAAAIQNYLGSQPAIAGPVAYEIFVHDPAAPVPPVALPAAPDASGSPDVSVFFEVRTLKVPAGFCERAGVKLTGNTVLGDDDVRRLLEAAQALPNACVMQFPKVTADDGQTMTVRNCEQRQFVTGVDATRVKGQTVLISKNTSVELGDTLVVSGQVSRDAQTVSVKASLTRTRLAGEVDLIPVVTQVTPVFEGGSQGKPIAFTQFIQSPDVKTEKVEKFVILSAGHTIVLGSWKETAELAKQPERPKLLPRKEKPAAEYEVVAFATVRVLRAEEPTVAPMPREAAKAYPLRNVAAADAAAALATYLKGVNLDVSLTFDAVTNTIFVQAEPGVQARVRTLLAGLDRAPAQVVMQVTMLRVPQGFVSQAGLDVGSDHSSNAWTLSPREAQMFAGLLRAEKERGGCEVLSRPQLCLRDGQTGTVAVGGLQPVVSVSKGPKTEYVQTGLTLKITPTVKPDSAQVVLNAEGKFTSSAVPAGQFTVSAFTDHTFRAGAELRDGHTLVIASSASDGNRSFCGRLRDWCAGDSYQTLVILTPHIVAPAPEVKPVGR